MVTIEKRTRNSKKYFYLVHSFRENGKVVKKQLYLGEETPKNIEELKKDFMLDLYREKWFDSFDKIKKNYKGHVKKLPLSARKKELENFVIKFTYDSQKIEGSTLSLKQTADLIELGITPANRPVDDVKEAENHNKLFLEMLKYEKDLSYQIMLYWHKRLFSDTKPEIAGKVRTHGVGIARSKFVPPPPVEMELLLKEFFDWYKNNKKKLHPVELAALVHLKFVTIHPFGDGNGRLSRLMMNFVLNKHGFPMMNIPYSKRTSYYNALERAQMRKEDKIFTQWFFRRYEKENKEYLKD